MNERFIRDGQIKGIYNAAWDFDGVLAKTDEHQQQLKVKYPELFAAMNFEPVASDDGLTVAERALKQWYFSTAAFISELKPCDRIGDGLEKLKSDGQFNEHYVVTARGAFLEGELVDWMKTYHLWDFFAGIRCRQSPDEPRALSKTVNADSVKAVLMVEDDGTQIYDIAAKRLAVLIDKPGNSWVRDAAPDPCIKIYHDVKEFADDLDKYGDVGGLYGFHYFSMDEKWEEFRKRLEVRRERMFRAQILQA